MSRQLLCVDCALRRLPAGTRRIQERSEEGEPAEYQRLVVGVAKAPNPETHVITVNEAVYPLDPSFYICDDCNAAIRPGDRCAGWTVWLEWMEEPPEWEGDFLEERG